jgi:hypothetical protein
LGVYPLTRNLLGPGLNILLFLGILLLLIVVLIAIKKRLTPARTGFVKFGEAGKKRLRYALIVNAVLILLTTVTWIMNARGIAIQEPVWNNLPEWVSVFDVDILFTLVILAIFCTVAYALDVPRYYLYGVLVSGGNLSSTVMMIYHSAKINWPLMVSGLIILAVGIWVLARFMKDYPIQTMEA